MNFKTLTAAAFLAALPAMASAVTVTPVAADCDPSLPDVLGTASVCGGADRDDASNVNFGEGDGKFFSLGLGGIAAFEVTPEVSGPGGGATYEVTFAGTEHFEAMAIWVGNLLDFSDIVQVATVNNTPGPVSQSKNFTIALNGAWKYILFQDISLTVFPESKTADGFDLDAFTVTTVPVPAAGFLLLAGLGGLAALKRRKAA